MKKQTLSMPIAVALLLVLASGALAQLELPRPSPKATVTQWVGLSEVTIAYSSPGVKGRTIWGGLVPYGEVWRTGANEATTITFNTEATISGNKVPAGTYGLFTLPGEKDWTVILNKAAEQWGAYEYKQEADLVRFTVTPRPVPATERMTFSFGNTTIDSTEVTLTWEKLQISFPLQVDVNAKVLADSRAAMATLAADDFRTPLRAASYCLDNNVSLAEARTWLAKSLAIKETMGNLVVKARFAALDGDKNGAIAIATKAIEVGKAADPKADTAVAERLLADWRK